MSGDGAVSEGQAVRAGGGTDHIRTAAAQPGQNEGNQEDLQVCHNFKGTCPLRGINQTCRCAGRAGFCSCQPGVCVTKLDQWVSQLIWG